MNVNVNVRITPLMERFSTCSARRRAVVFRQRAVTLSSHITSLAVLTKANVVFSDVNAADASR